MANLCYKSPQSISVELTLLEVLKDNIQVSVDEGDCVKLTGKSIKGSVTGTAAICRQLLSLVENKEVVEKLFPEGGDNLEVENWLRFSLIHLSGTNLESSGALSILNNALSHATFLVSDRLTLADIAVWSKLMVNPAYEKALSSQQYPHLKRYVAFLDSQPAFSNVKGKLSSLMPKGQNQTTTGETGGRFEIGGKFTDLPHAEMGKVVVRFPPEASGYLHIGHAKAALLNQHYKDIFKGTLILRFDDTNPAKENAEFEEVILKDVELLGIKYDRFTRTSDYFDEMLDLCEKIIRMEKAYVDDMDTETIRQYRERREETPSRSNSVKRNLELWEEMKKGSGIGLKCCVRAKIDLKSDNGCLRDPTIYRCKLEPHLITGDKYKTYPTYDFACPIVDSIEGVTHTLRTTEYLDRDPQYYWFIEALGIRRPYIKDYSRLVLQNTVLSKRKLTWFVQEKMVDGWADPRFPTVRGIRRRGMTVEGLREFIIAQGSSRSVCSMEWDKIWSFNKKIIDPIAPRYTALGRDSVVPVFVTDQTKTEEKKVPLHPKDTSVGEKTVWVSNKILVEQEDAKEFKEGENVTFINWGNLKIRSITRDSNNVVTRVDAVKNLQDTDYRKTLKVTWLADCPEGSFVPAVCVTFGPLMTKAVLAKDDDFRTYVNRDSRKDEAVVGEPSIRHLKKGDIIQLQRKGFYICDEPYEEVNRHTGRPAPCILFNIPDGHTKEKPTLGSKQKTAENKKQENHASAGSKRQKSTAVPSSGGDQPKSATPTPAAPSGGNSAISLAEQIKQQGDTIRDMKAKKVSKNELQPHIDNLLKLKNSFKSLTNCDWSPNWTPPSESAGTLTPGNSTQDAVVFSDQIKQVGDTIRDLKAKKTAKNELQPHIDNLLKLKASFKSVTNTDWSPSWTPPAAVSAGTPSASNSNEKQGSADQLLVDIKSLGDKIRQLKATHADKTLVLNSVEELKKLKSAYFQLTGTEWSPDVINKINSSPVNQPTSSPAPSSSPSSLSNKSLNLLREIKSLGDNIRDLKASKADKTVVKASVDKLVNLKSEFKTASGLDWHPNLLDQQSNSPAQTAPSPTDNKAGHQGIPPVKSLSMTSSGFSDDCCILLNKIKDLGDQIRVKKSEKADKKEIDALVQNLLSLKTEFKAKSGQEWKPDLINKVSKPQSTTTTSNKVKPEPSKPAPAPTGSKGDVVKTSDEPAKLKKQTKLGIDIKMSDDFSEWYSQVITKSEMIEYYDVSGCYILRPWSYSIWEKIHDFFDAEIKKLGVKNSYFPIFVSQAALEREKKHIEDFAPEVAWVTRSGKSELAEPIAVRPTSETVMYPAYARWIQSYRDLPLKLNQWNNVVRWEFKNPQPFLRTREFLWQEGHTAFATKEEAVEEVYTILDLYRRIYEELLALPVIPGRKTENEKFPGGDFTTTVEGYVPTTGRGIQGATSHYLGQNFSKMFDIVFEHPETSEKSFVHQNSWGVTTRSIGVMVMVHGDDRGLVLPPRVADIQAIIIPCGLTANQTAEEKQSVYEKCREIKETLAKASVRVDHDLRDNYSPGWKFNHWELKGVPLRIEIGPKDILKQQVTAVRRDNSEKVTLPEFRICGLILDLLETIQNDMFNKAKSTFDSHIVQASTFDELCSGLDNKCLIVAPFCGEEECEKTIKEDSARNAVVEEGAPSMGAKSLCIPNKQPDNLAQHKSCINPKCRKPPAFFTLFGRSY